MFVLLLCVVTFLTIPTWAYRKHDAYPIVGLFHPEQIEQEKVFRLAVEKVNLDNNYFANFELRSVSEYFSHFDSFNTSKRVCSLIEEGIAGIFGPQSVGTTRAVQAICDLTEIPHIDTRWDTSSKFGKMNINFYPETKLLAKAIIGIIDVMDWKTYTIVYENDEGLLRLQEVLKPIQDNSSERHIPFVIRQLPDDTDQDYRSLLKGIKKSGVTHIVLECSTDKILPILQQAKQVGLMGEYTSFILTSLDAHTLDFSEYKFDRTNITALRLVNPNSRYVKEVLEDWRMLERQRGNYLRLSANQLKTESALVFDAVMLYAKALHGVNVVPVVRRISCNDEEKWRHGFEILNYMKLLSEEGMTGAIKFDKYGKRNYFSLEIIELAKEGFKTIGTWDSIHGVNYTRTQREMIEAIAESITQKEFIVTSRIERPFLEEVVGEGLVGNARYEGYSMDLIDAISKLLGCKYKFTIVPDKQRGTLNKETMQWNGLIREIQDKKADLAICDLTITTDRRSAVDFTMPFMTLGISILYSKPPLPERDLFSFMKPFSFDVWIYMATAYLGISMLLFFLSRISPYEWNSPHPCDSSPQVLENKLTMNNLIWHNCGSLMQQGSDVAPQALSTRLVAGMWWFFILIMISSYTANLAAFLTQKQMDTKIENVEQLSKQNKVKYGLMVDGSTYNFFKTSNETTYQKMWSVMKSAQPSVFVATNDEGVDRVRKSKNGYAFFMESTTIEFQMEQYCDLTQIGGLLDSKTYGIAMPSNSPYRTAISGAVLRLQEQGKLKDMKKKWWSHWKSNNSKCEHDTLSEKPSNELGMANVGGVFIVLISGFVCAFCVSILEFLWNVRKVAVVEKITPTEALMSELKFVVQCHKTTKAVKRASTPKSNSFRGSFLSLNIFDRFNSKEHSVPRNEPMSDWVPELRQ